MQRRSRRPSGLAFGAALLLVLTTIAPAGAVEPPNGLTQSKELNPVKRIEGFKSASSQLARTDPELLKRKDADPVNVMIKLDYDGSASYAGGIEGLAATSPHVTCKPLSRVSAPERDYAAYVAGQESAFVKDL